ncbi:MAG: class I SAM-dependent methyltransferase [Bacteroidales bacterium]|jgi:ubiquinone/menaquinone biosynthesis C-methylase UbiE|nr:class I SAM-dependent methyltransferase [Bacteroidales bacterium]NLM93535.1 class I SAM-dependent methyltransferase [Bacteroidales bacterium]
MKENPFDLFSGEYEDWFSENAVAFRSEVLALRQLIPQEKQGLEIGIGSGIFARELGIPCGIDPSENMLRLARERGLNVMRGYAEQLPYKDQSFDYAAFITSLCFISHPRKSLQEAFRVIRDGGTLVVAIIDRESALGRRLEEEKASSKFYRQARFYSVPEMLKLMMQASFEISRIIQTLAEPPGEVPEKPIKGYGKGGFVVIEAIKIRRRPMTPGNHP